MDDVADGVRSIGECGGTGAKWVGFGVVAVADRSALGFGDSGMIERNQGSETRGGTTARLD